MCEFRLRRFGRRGNGHGGVRGLESTVQEGRLGAVITDGGFHDSFASGGLRGWFCGWKRKAI